MHASLLARCSAAGLTMVESVDLVVLGAFYGSGAKTHLLSSFLMGAPDDDAPCGWSAVCKLANGFSVARLEELLSLFTQGDGALMRKLDKAAPLPSWCPPSAKGSWRPDLVLKSDPAAGAGAVAGAPSSLVWEVKGTEFSPGSKATGSEVSIRFPRLVREREDKGVEDATSFATIKEMLDLGLDGKKKNVNISIATLTSGAASEAAAAAMAVAEAAGTSSAAAAGASSGVSPVRAAADDGAETELSDQDVEEDKDDDAQQDSPLSRRAAATSQPSVFGGGGNGKAKADAMPKLVPSANGKAKATVDMRPYCKFGASCYRKNPQHLAEFRHDAPPAGEKRSDESRSKVGPSKATGKPKPAGKRKRRADESEDEEDEEDDEGFIGRSGDEEDEEDADWQPLPVLPSRTRRVHRPKTYAEDAIDEEEDEEDDEEEDEKEEDQEESGGCEATEEDEPEEAQGTAAPMDVETAPPLAAAAAIGVPAPVAPAPAPATATVPAGASHRTGTWEVLLGKQFKAYEEAAVQDQIEAAWLADEDQVEVTVRGSCYMLRISASEMVQEAKGDPSRWRSIRRVVR